MHHIYKESSIYFPETLYIYGDKPTDNLDLEFRDDILTIRTYCDHKLDYTERFKVTISPLKDLELFLKQNVTYEQAMEEIQKLKLKSTRDLEVCFHKMIDYCGLREKYKFCDFCGLKKYD